MATSAQREVQRLRGFVHKELWIDKASIKSKLSIHFVFVLLGIALFFIAEPIAPVPYKQLSYTVKGVSSDFMPVVRDDDLMLNSSNQYFTITATIERKDEGGGKFSSAGAEIQFQTQILYRDDLKSESWKLIHDTQSTWEINCEENKKHCEAITIFRQVKLSYPQYKVKMHIMRDLPTDLEFIEQIRYTVRNVNASFTFFELSVKGIILGFTLWRYCNYNTSLNFGVFYPFTITASKQIENRLVSKLLTSLFLFIDPFFFLWCIFGIVEFRFISIISILSSWFLFYGVLLVWLLYAFRKRRVSDKGNTGRASAVRITALTVSTFLGLFWVISLVLAVYVSSQIYKNPTYNYMKFKSNFEIVFYCGISGIALLLFGVLVSTSMIMGATLNRRSSNEKDITWDVDRSSRALFLFSFTFTYVGMILLSLYPYFVSTEKITLHTIFESLLTMTKYAKYTLCSTVYFAMFVFFISMAFEPLNPIYSDEEIFAFLGKTGEYDLRNLQKINVK